MKEEEKRRRGWEECPFYRNVFSFIYILPYYMQN